MKPIFYAVILSFLFPAGVICSEIEDIKKQQNEIETKKTVDKKLDEKRLEAIHKRQNELNNLITLEIKGLINQGVKLQKIQRDGDKYLDEMLLIGGSMYGLGNGKEFIFQPENGQEITIYQTFLAHNLWDIEMQIGMDFPGKIIFKSIYDNNWLKNNQKNIHKLILKGIRQALKN